MFNRTKTSTDDVAGTPTQTRDDGRHAQAAYDEGYADGHDPSIAQEVRRERFGGLNPGAAFFGWLVAIAVSVLLTGIVGAIAAAVGSSTHITQSQAEAQAGTIGLVAAIVLLAVLMIGYYCRRVRRRPDVAVLRDQPGPRRLDHRLRRDHRDDRARRDLRPAVRHPQPGEPAAAAGHRRRAEHRRHHRRAGGARRHAVRGARRRHGRHALPPPRWTGSASATADRSPHLLGARTPSAARRAGPGSARCASPARRPRRWPRRPRTPTRWCAPARPAAGARRAGSPGTPPRSGRRRRAG